MECGAVRIRENSLPLRSRGFDTRAERSTLHLPGVAVRSNLGDRHVVPAPLWQRSSQDRRLQVSLVDTKRDGGMVHHNRIDPDTQAKVTREHSRAHP
jgi:hypothetical protein